MPETAPTGAGMTTTCTAHTPPTDAERERAAEKARAQRYAARAGMGLVTHPESPSARRRLSLCGTPLGPDVLISKTGTSAGYAGIGTCGSIHCCPVCAAKISTRRRADLHAAMVEWQARGGDFIFMTLTVRHNARQSLAAVWGGLSDAWRSVVSSASWKRERERCGIVHYVKWSEITHGEAGWHPHYHVLLFVEGGITEEAAEALGASIFGRWSKGARNAGLSVPLLEVTRNGKKEKVAIDTRVVRGKAENAGAELLAMADYLAKLGLYSEADELYEAAHNKQDEANAATARAVSGLASEVSLGQFKGGGRDSDKAQKRVSGRTPFTILRDILDYIRKDMRMSAAAIREDLRAAGQSDLEWLNVFAEGASKEFQRDLRLWREWVETSRGRRLTSWSRDLRRELLPDTEERTDEELAADMGEVDEWVGKMSSTAYAHIRRQAPEDLGRILNVAGRAADTAEATTRVNAILARHGLPGLQPVTDDDVSRLGGLMQRPPGSWT